MLVFAGLAVAIQHPTPDSTLMVQSSSQSVSTVTAQSDPRLAPRVELSDGRHLPEIGLGVYRLSPGNETYGSVRTGLELGFRHIDTAQLYFNEKSVGEAVRDSGIPRKSLWVTTKMSRNFLGLPTGFNETLKTLRTSLAHLQMEYVDLYLIHSPAPTLSERLAQWYALLEANRLGLARSIGVSDYLVPQLQELAHLPIGPAVLQIEISPSLSAVRANVSRYCYDHRIVLEAWGALGGPSGKQQNDSTLATIAASHNVSEAAVLIKWSLQQGFVPLVTSTNAAHIAEDLSVATSEWNISADEMAGLDTLGAHPIFSTGRDIAGVTS